MENLKKTPIYSEHVRLGARLVPFAGWEMPIQYGSIIEEHKCVREKVGIFDVSHMGEIFVYGEDSLKFLQKIVPQDISKLPEGKAVYCQLTNDNAGMIDDLIIYRRAGENSYLLIVNASRIEEDFAWIKKNSEGYKVNIENKSDEYAMIALQGPLAKDVINDMGISYTDQPSRFCLKETKLDLLDVFLARTGYTGEDGFEIVVRNEDAVELWQELLSKGEKYGIKPIGLGARDTLRLEAAMHLYGQDMDENATPVEASLSWSVPRDKTEDYNGKKRIQEQLAGIGKDKILVGFKMIDKAIPRHNYEIYKDGAKVGIVTSGGVAPSINANIGLGYINTFVPSSVDTEIDIKIRDKFYKAQIVKRPFYTKG